MPKLIANQALLRQILNKPALKSRWEIMRPWVNRYRNGAAYTEMMECPEAQKYGDWVVYVNKHLGTQFAEDKRIPRTIETVNMIVAITHIGFYDKTPFPIKVTIDGAGTLHSFDGAHRMMILAALGQDVPIEFDTIHDTFIKATESITQLYQPSTHPFVQHLPVNRKDLQRYHVISEQIKQLKLKQVCEIGCAEGEGALILSQSANVVGVEIDDGRYTLARALCFDEKQAEIVPRLSDEKFEAFIGLSVWHHLAKNIQQLDEWIDTVKHANVQFVEMPEAGSATFSQELVEQTGWDASKIGQCLLEYLMKKGNYANKTTIFVDTKYANRETVMLQR